MYLLKTSTVGLSVCLVTLLSGCGTFSLGTAIPQASRTPEQQQLDTLSCKDAAKLAANSGERQAGAFLLGLTIIGAPLAFQLEKSKQIEVYKTCMEGKGYRVIPPVDDSSTSASNAAPSTSTTSIKIDLPAGWQQKELTGALKSGINVMMATNEAMGTGLLISSVKKSDISDSVIYVKNRIGSQLASLDNAVATEIFQTTINGIPVWQAEVSGNLKSGTKASYVYWLTFFDASNEIVLINMWALSPNFKNQKQSFEQILGAVSGISPAYKLDATPSPIKVKIDNSDSKIRLEDSNQSFNKRLSELNELLKKNLITQKDYDAKKAEILKLM